ncbi:MAG: glycosyltransferase [bacterium]|nr:glycosyltransferase [bacterium]
MKIRVDQFISSFYPKSAEGAVFNDILEIQKTLREAGCISDIFTIDPEKGSGAKFYSKYNYSSKNNIVIYQYGEGSILTDFLIKLKTKKVLRYHGVTPPKFLKETSKSLLDTIGGNKDTKLLIYEMNSSLATSEYTKTELRNFGFNNIHILPVFIDFNKYKKIPKAASKTNKNLIFVGRLVPNKKQEDIIKTFYYYHKINPKSNLFLIGEYKSCPRYVDFLKKLVTDLELNKNVCLTGQITFDELVNFYGTSDIFICMSEHEGFCVPLLEAMYFNLPIIAYKSTAIPYTLENTGILINRKNYPEIAELINIILTDKKLCSEIIKKQNNRLKEFSLENTKNKLIKYIEEI